MYVNIQRSIKVFTKSQLHNYTALRKDPIPALFLFTTTFMPLR
jgi:hypothetical protein